MEVRKRIRRDEATWREIFARQAASGLLVSQFCRQEEINPGVFRRWREVLQVPGPGPGKPVKAVPVRREIVKPFVDLGALGTSASRCEIRLELGGGVTLSVVRG
ncbi:MAG: hypothetical protein WBW93_02870 [Steroidobacteraceae bacterium]